MDSLSEKMVNFSREIKTIKISKQPSPAPVPHICNPRYSGGRDQEDLSSKPVWPDNSARPYLEKPFTKIGLVE
jgi:hypothetical protein